MKVRLISISAICYAVYKLYNHFMDIPSIPKKALETLLQDALGRDTVTARRTHLLKILLHERYLSREQLIVRWKACSVKAALAKEPGRIPFIATCAS